MSQSSATHQSVVGSVCMSNNQSIKKMLPHTGGSLMYKSVYF